MTAAILSVHPFGKHLTVGRGAAFIVLVAFLISFLLIRTSARLTRSVSWWPGGVQSGGVHLHHLVWGICLMMISGFLAFAAPLESPWWDIVAVGFGVGMGFTLDEFALWVRLQDVYWADEGRASVDAVIIASAFAALVVLGSRPFGLDDPGSIWGTVGVIAILLGLVVVSAAKGRVFLALLGMFIPLFALWGAFRLANPRSLWAKRFYNERKIERAHNRFAAIHRLEHRVEDFIGGAPSDECNPVPEQSSLTSSS